MSIRCFIVSDDLKSTAAFARLVNHTPGVELAGCENNGRAALNKLLVEGIKADVLFLDIDTRGLDYLSFSRQLGSAAEIVFITSFDGYAVEAFNIGAADYIVKPLLPKRIMQALMRVQAKIVRTSDAAEPYVMVRVGNRSYERIILANLVWVEAHDKDLWLSCIDREKRVVCPQSLTHFQQVLPAKSFVRIHKSYLLNLNYVKSISQRKVNLTNGISLDAGQSYIRDLYWRLNIT